MAHNLEYNEVLKQYSFLSARQPAWHQLGKVLPENFNSEKILTDVINFTIEKEPMRHALTGDLTDFHQLIRINPNNEIGKVLHVVGKDYGVTQPSDFLNFMNAIIGESKNGYHYETAGVLGEGEQIFASAYAGSFDLKEGKNYENYCRIYNYKLKTFSERIKSFERNCYKQKYNSNFKLCFN